MFVGKEERRFKYRRFVFRIKDMGSEGYLGVDGCSEGITSGFWDDIAIDNDKVRQFLSLRNLFYYDLRKHNWVLILFIYDGCSCFVFIFNGDRAKGDGSERIKSSLESFLINVKSFSESWQGLQLSLFERNYWGKDSGVLCLSSGTSLDGGRALVHRMIVLRTGVGSLCISGEKSLTFIFQGLD